MMRYINYFNLIQTLNKSNVSWMNATLKIMVSSKSKFANKHCKDSVTKFAVGIRHF